jgi:hypothetical protein
MAELIVIQVRPVWGQMPVVKAVTGVPDNVVRRLVNEHLVRARKMDPAKENSACLFNVQDVLDWVEKDATEPKRFKVG